jgi:hypothetical protein
MNTIYYFSVLHSLVIADEFTGEDMEKILYHMFSCKNIFIRFYSYLNSDILVNPCKILLNGSFISEEIIVKVQTHENLLIECLLNDI